MYPFLVGPFKVYPGKIADGDRVLEVDLRGLDGQIARDTVLGARELRLGEEEVQYQSAIFLASLLDSMFG